jgi:hypothetical protein
MIGTAKIANHMSVEELKSKMQMTAGFLKMQKWLVIYNAIIDPRPIPEIAKHTGLSEASVYRIINEYNSSGPETIEKTGKAGMRMWFENQTRTVSM